MNFFASLAFTFAVLSQVPHLPPLQSPADSQKNPKAEKKTDPIPFPHKALSKDDKRLNRAIAENPVTERDGHIEAPKKIVDYFIARPYLASRMMEEMFDGSLTLMKDDDSGEWEATMKGGGSYTLRMLYSEDAKYIVWFDYFYRAVQGIGLKFSAAGVFVLRSRKGEDKEKSIAEYDIYITAGNLPLDKPAQALYLHRKWIRRDMMSAMESFTALCEAVAEDAGEIAEEMENEDETFTKTEIDNFKKAFKVK